jgi:hypothetical protein
MTDWKDLFKDTNNKQEIPPKTSATPKPNPVKWKDLFGVMDSLSTAKDTSQFPNAPQWADVIQPTKTKTETAKGVGEFIVGGAAKFDQALAGMFNQLDYVQTTLGDAINTILLGKDAANGIKDIRNKYGVNITPQFGGDASINTIRPFKVISSAIDMAYKDAKELPNTIMGDIVGSIGALGPEILTAAVAPEIKTSQILAKYGMPVLSKFGMVMGAEGAIAGAQSAETGTTMQKLTTPFIGAVEQYVTGQVYDMMGAMSSKLGSKLALKFVHEIKTKADFHTSMLIRSLGTTSSNALAFGGYGTLNEFLETGKSSWKTFWTGVGTGVGLGAREVGKTMWAKGINTFIASDMNTIKRAVESEISSDEMISHSQEKIKAVESKTSKNPEGDVASAILSNNTAMLKSVLEEIKENPQDVVKSVEESTLPSEIKNHIIDKINQVVVETDPMAIASKSITDKISDLDAQIDMIKKNSNLAPVLQEIKIKSLAAKREGLVNKVIKIVEETKPEIPDAVKQENLKQARIVESRAAQIFPQFQAEGEALANELGGRFESRLKTVESTSEKAGREGVASTDVKDIMGGAVIVGNMKDLKNVSKKLKKEGYSISNKRVANKDTGRLGIIATKIEDGIGREIQIHTEKTWEAQKAAEAIRDKYRKEGIPPVDVVDVETNPAKYKAEDQVKSHEETGSSTFSMGGENLTGKKGKASVSLFPERSETISKTVKSEEQKTMEEPVFPEGFTPDVQQRKSGKDKVSIEDAEGNEISHITFKTVKVNEDKYWSIQQAVTATGNEGKGYATNLYKYAMKNLPEGYKGIISPASTRQNKVQIPKIHEKLAKIFDVQKAENGDIIFRPKTEGLTPEEIKTFIEKNKDILEGNEDILSISTRKKSDSEHTLDIVATTNKDKAIELGKKYNQESVTDLENMKEVSTGTKKGDIGTIPFEERIKDLRITPRSLYEEAMAESRRLYEEGYAGLENVDLEGSPAKTPLERKMKSLEIPIAEQKELKKAWTETKNKILSDIKAKNSLTPSKRFYRGGIPSEMPKNATAEDVITYERDKLGNKDIQVEPDIDLKKIDAKNLSWLSDTKEYAQKFGDVTQELIREGTYKVIARYPEGGILIERLSAADSPELSIKDKFKDFIKGMPSFSGLGVKLQKRMLNKVNSIDFTKPASLNRAIDYFDKIVNNATWRFNEAKAEQALDILDKQSTEKSLSKKVSGQPDKNIKGIGGLPLWDAILGKNGIRDNMLNKNWAEGQEAINKIYAKIDEEGRQFPTAEEMDQITKYNFWGLLNETSVGGANSYVLQGAARDLMEIRKAGSSKAAAARMVQKAQEAEIAKLQAAAIAGKKVIETDPRNIQNMKNSFLKEFGATVFDWPMSSSLFSHIEFFSQNDTTSKPNEGILHETLGEPMWYANRQLYIDRTNLFNEITKKAEEIYGKKELNKNAKDRTSIIHNIKYKNILGKDKELNLTTNQAIKVYMELQDLSLEKSNEAGYYKRNGELTDLGQKVIDILTPQDKAWADWQLNEFYPRLYEFLNPIYRQMYGRDMPYSDMYSPIFIEGVDSKKINDDDLLSRQSFASNVKNGSLLSRVKHDKPLRLMDADQVLMSYVHNMTYWKNYAEPIRILNSFVSNPDIRNTIKQVFAHGDQHLRILQKDVADLLHKPTDAWMTAKTIRKVRNNILFASLALKIPVGIKQLSSIPAFMEYIPMKEIPKYAIQDLTRWMGDKNNIELAKKLWNDAYLQQRYGQGWDNVITEILAADYHSIANKSDWRHKAMFPISGFDATSIFIGGIPVYRYAYDQAIKAGYNKKLAEAKALHTFSRAVDDTQQSGLHFNLSQVQTANDFFKTMTMYKSAPMQYHRKVSAATRNLFTGRGSWQQNVKTIAIYHVVMPALFQFMANGFKWDTKDELWAGAIGNLNNLFALGDIGMGLLNVAQGESWKKYNVSPILSTYDDAAKVVEHLPKVHMSDKEMIEGVPPEYIDAVRKAAEDYRWNTPELLKTIKYASKIIGAGLGLPIPGATAIGEGIYDVSTGKEEGKPLTYKIQRILGSSDYTLGNAVDDSDLTPEEVEKILNEKAKPSENLNKPIDKPLPNKKDRKIPNF